MTEGVRLPGMESAVAGPAAGHFGAFRIGANDWGVLAPAADLVDLRESAARTFLPSASLQGADGVFARLELDKCGAWMTLAVHGHARPVVVRRAGWIDVRGHVNGQDDRVGLGPGDAIVFPTDALLAAADATGERFGDEALAEALLDCAGAHAGALADHIVEAAAGFVGSSDVGAAVLVARVPEEAGRDPIERVVEATGVPADQLQLPGYPLGDEQPDLWSRPPDPPREARIRLAPIAASVPRMRDLLRRLLRSWRMPDAGDGIVELLATELAANAVQHARSDMTVIVRYLGDVVRIEVGDGSREQPRPRQAHDDDIDGRGLALVEVLAKEWGTLPTRTGKRVWCDVAIDTGSRHGGDG